MAKTNKVAEDWTAGGNEFQVTDAATGNERQPTVVRRYAGTCSSRDADERRRWRPGRSYTCIMHPLRCVHSSTLVARRILRQGVTQFGPSMRDAELVTLVCDVTTSKRSLKSRITRERVYLLIAGDGRSDKSPDQSPR